MSVNQAHKQVKAKQRKAGKMEKMRAAAQATVTPLNKLGKFSVIYADPPWQYEHETQGRQEIEECLSHDVTGRYNGASNR